MIVFPMAGLSHRFNEYGYLMPKYMLPLWGGYVFDYAVSSFAKQFRQQPFLFIYRETGGVRDFIETRIKVLGIDDARFAVLDKPTAGQAETVELGLKISKVKDNTPLAIFNIDTFRNPKSDPFSLLQGYDGWLEVFHGERNSWSFIRSSKNKKGIVEETTEKIPISDICSSGFY